MHSFNLLSALAGGALIGLSASMLLATHGRIAGISGILGGLLRRDAADGALGAWFFGGLLLAGSITRIFAPQAFESSWSASLPVILVAGLLVGFGTQLGSGCTSGHGICGLARLSARSLVAMLSFMGAGVASVYVVRHIVGNAP